jgi:hypothetical protein
MTPHWSQAENSLAPIFIYITEREYFFLGLVDETPG